MTKMMPVYAAVLAAAPAGAAVAGASDQSPFASFNQQTANAAVSQVDAMEGAYLLQQTNKNQRVLTLDADGTASVISQGQAVVGYTTGKGSWEQTGPKEARAVVVDFTYNEYRGAAPGPGVTVYDVTFNGKTDGKFEGLAGSLSGKQFASGENPFTTRQEPSRTWGTDFKGERISATLDQLS